MVGRRAGSFALVVALLASLGAAPAPAVAAPLPGPVAEWTFDEASGTTAQDAIGNLDGTLAGGVTRITSNVKQGAGALQFDGVDDLVTVADNATLTPADSFSLAFWMRGGVNSYATTHVLVSKGAYGCDRGGAYEVLQSTDQLATTSLHTAYSGYAVWTGAPGAWSDGQWHLAVMTWDDVADVVTFTVDGHAQSTAVPSPDEVAYGDASKVDGILRFGAAAAGCEGRDGFTGSLDDIRLWNRALSRSEILAMLPVTPTSTDVVVETQNPWDSYTSEPSHTVFVDDHLLLASQVAPWPGSDGTVTFYGSYEGGAEQVLGTGDLTITQGPPSFAYLFLPVGSLDVGSWSIRAAWPGVDNWTASSSDPWALEVQRRTVALALSASTPELLPGESTTLRADASITVPGPSTVPDGSVSFYETTGGTETLLGSAPLNYVNNIASRASLTIAVNGNGTHTYEARFAETPVYTSATATTDVTVGTQLVSVGLWFAPNPTLNTMPATAYVSASGYRRNTANGPSLPAPTGTITIRTSPGGSIVATVPLSDGTGNVAMPVVATGDHAFIAEYPGDANFEPATSGPVTLTAAADILDASGVGLQYTTFYPYKDAYRDTVAIRGTRNETISVSIRIYSPTGSRLRTVSIASGGGAYSYAWNGRNSSGSMYAAGKYRIVQVLKDAAGVTKTVTSYVNLSAKRLYTYTKSYTKDHTQTSRKTTSWIAWSFTLPSATVYKSLTFSVYGVDSVGSGGFGPHDFTWCSSSTWSPNCTTRWKSFPVSWAWRSVTGSASKDRTGRGVRLYAWGGYGATQVKYGRVKVTYGILK